MKKRPKWWPQDPPRLFKRGEIARLHRYYAGTGDKIFVRVFSTKVDRYNNEPLLTRYYRIEPLNAHPNLTNALRGTWKIEQRFLTKLTKTDRGD